MLNFVPKKINLPGEILICVIDKLHKHSYRKYICPRRNILPMGFLDHHTEFSKYHVKKNHLFLKDDFCQI